MTPIPPPGRRPKRPADRAMMVAIAIVALIGMILGWIIRDVAVRAAPVAIEPSIEPEPTQTRAGKLLHKDVQLSLPTARPEQPDSELEEPEPEQEPEPYFRLTDSERSEIERVVMAEAGGEPYEGQVAVAQCIRDTAIRDKLRPSEVIVEYKYTPDRKEPTQSVQEAVRAVFDDGESVIDTAYYFYAPALVTSKWHEAQEFVTELGGHRFFR
jgi:spore germination cell wall hydrolase CwlJ-like protein